MRVKQFAYTTLVGTVQHQIEIVYTNLKRIAALLKYGVNHNSDTRPTNGETWIGL